MRHALPVVVLLALHIALTLTGAYSIPHVDSVMHFAGGIALGMLIFGLLLRAASLGWVPAPGKLLTFVLILSLVTTGAVFWEFFEWTCDRLLGTGMQSSIGDTMKDLILGQFGAVVYALAVIRLIKPRPTLHRHTVRAESSMPQHIDYKLSHNLSAQNHRSN